MLLSLQVRLTALLIPCLACTDASGPDLSGPPHFRATVNGTTWAPGLPFSGCGDFALLISVPVATAIPDNDLLEIRVQDVVDQGSYALGDSASGGYVHTLNLRSGGPTHHTVAGAGDRLLISGISFRDSVVAGSFHFRLVSAADPNASYAFVGTFRLPLVPRYTVQHPDGTPCFGAT